MKSKKKQLLSDNRVFLIAEAGVNHNGDIEIARKLIDVAAESGADAVKFQTWKPGELTGKFAIKVKYIDNGSDETRYDISKNLALPYPVFKELKTYANKKGILFLSTPDGFESLDFLVDKLDMPIIKISSTEITHLAFLRAVAGKNRPVILSTGMSTLGEVERCVQILHTNPCSNHVLLHCTSEYPAPLEEVNLKAMVTMREAFKMRVGFSDHTPGCEAAIASVALGATVVEKHFTVDKTLPGPDHKASLSPEELNHFVGSIRRTEELLGDGIKKPSHSELRNINGIRRGVVAARELSKGTVLSREMLAAKRPFIGIEPEQLSCFIGHILRRSLSEDEPIHWDDIR